jgi:hypothetical protein
MVEGMKRCGRDLTVENFVKAMDSIKDFQGIGGKLSFSPDKRQGGRTFFLAKCVEGGKAIRISDWMSSGIDIQKVIERLGR